LKKGRRRRCGGTDLSIDEDLFQPWSPLCIDRGAAQARWTAATRTAAARSTATTRSAKGQEDIYEGWRRVGSRVVVVSFPDGGGGVVVVASGLEARLKPRPKAARGAKGVGLVSSSDI
jgi:hypothetical protein